VHPNATESCNNIDDDCDLQIDEGLKSTFYIDADHDGYGNASTSILACIGAPPPGYVADKTDCNDANVNIHPNATEICNTIDDNCDNFIDEATQLYTYTDDLLGAPSLVSQTVTATNLMRVNGVSSPAGCPTGFSSNNFSVVTTYNTSLSAIEFTVTPAGGNQIIVSSIAADLRRSNGGPAKVRFAYSLNGGATWIDQGVDRAPNNAVLWYYSK
jgi:hypothetical protein